MSDTSKLEAHYVVEKVDNKKNFINFYEKL